MSFFGPLTTYYNQAVRRWLGAHLGRTVTHYQAGELFNDAYVKAATVGIAASGFRATGLVPLNDSIFPDWMFSPSKTTDIPVSENHENLEGHPSNDSEAGCSNSDAVPSTSKVQNITKTPLSEQSNKDDSNAKVSKMIQELSPLPQP